MISFGELRRKSVEWQTEISAVEKLYARDWLLKGIFDRPALLEQLALRETSALASAYFLDYPRVADVDFARAAALDDALLEREVRDAVGDAARASGLQFRLAGFKPSEARVEFTGPLGRRSAAQPLIVMRFVVKTPRAALSRRALLHPFSDACAATVRAIALDELTAEHMVRYAQKPRARDVYDLWFILTRGEDLDVETMRGLAQAIALEKRVTLSAALNAAYAPLLERAWENALKDIRGHPPLALARQEIETRLQAILAQP